MKRIFLLFFSLLILFFLLPTKLEAKSSGLSIQFEAGVDGSIKYSRGFPLKITITNKGESFKGDLVFRFSTSKFSIGEKVLPIQVDSGQQKVYTISLPGLGEHYGGTEQNIFLYEGSWLDGKEVSFTGSKHLQPHIINDQQMVVGILSENPDRLKNMKGINENFYIVNVTEDQLGEDALAMEIFDYLIIDEYPISKLSKTKQDTLLAWIENGGIAIIGATDNAKDAYGAIYLHLPMQFENEKMIKNATIPYSDGKNLKINQLKVYTGKLDKQYVHLSSQDTPLVVEKEIGSGKIVQTAFSLGDEPTTSIAGYFPWFLQYLQETKPKQMVQNEEFDWILANMGEANEIFQESQISIGQLFIIILIYILILVPVLYWILKKKDKREQAWWIIPSISLITSIIIFAYGAKGRIFQPIKNELGIFMADDGHLTGYYIISFQTNTSGSYHLQVNKNEFHPIPLQQENFTWNPEKSKIPRFLENRKHTEIIFPNIEYWGIRSLSGKSRKQVEGSFITNLTVQNGKLTGTITNQYPFDFKELFIWSGTNQYKIGPLKKGKTISVNIDSKAQWLRQPILYDPSFWDIAQNNEKMRKDVLKNGYIFLSQLNTENQVILSGITEDEIISVEIKKENEKTNRLSIIFQPIGIDTIFSGSILLKNDDFSLRFIPIDSSSQMKWMPPSFVTGREIYLEPGKYELIYTIPHTIPVEKLTVRELSFQHSSNYGKMYLFNQRSREYILIDQNTMTINEQASDYLSKDGKMVLLLDSSDMSDPEVRLPSFTLKGDIGP